jgi:hypothetical protein
MIKKIEYQFKFASGETRTSSIQIETDNRLMVLGTSETLPAWTQLDFKKCSNCPLNQKEHPVCPVAKNLSRIVSQYQDVKSYEKVDVTVTTTERNYQRSLPLQEGLFGLFGLAMACSGCPHFQFLSAMAQFHLPFSTPEETIVRVTGFYLLSQYFVHKKGGKADFSLSNLEKAYEALQTVNKDFAQRIRGLGHGDADSNSIVILDAYAQILSNNLQVKLENFEKLFVA